MELLEDGVCAILAVRGGGDGAVVAEVAELADIGARGGGVEGVFHYHLGPCDEAEAGVIGGCGCGDAFDGVVEEFLAEVLVAVGELEGVGMECLAQVDGTGDVFVHVVLLF